MTEQLENDQVYAGPVKSFFVDMLTRDIELKDAVLDSLDNCIDGVTRQADGQGGDSYRGYYADITFDKNHFEISDNCGGIPIKLSEYAFRMGRPKSEELYKSKRTVGTYGIGMKRAIFKIGKECEIITSSEDANYKVNISQAWIEEEENWILPRKKTKKLLQENGTKIKIKKLNSSVSKQFSFKEGFEEDFISEVRNLYALIIQKGFAVKVNGKEITARPIKLLFEGIDSTRKRGELIRPFIYKTTKGDVDVFLAIGFTAPPPSTKELEEDAQERKYSSKDAGWTIICNDRVVLASDKSVLTGWGEAGVPNYHTQFIAISGIVVFSSDSARELPMTTTKRGVDANSEIYLTIKNKMREGLKLFTDFTNKWKGSEQQVKESLVKSVPLEINEIKARAGELKLQKTSRDRFGGQYKPKLPMPKVVKEVQNISFKRKIKEIELVKNYLFESPQNIKPSTVGEKCFDIILEEAKQ